MTDHTDPTYNYRSLTVVRAQNDTSKTATITDTIFNAAIDMSADLLLSIITFLYWKWYQWYLLF